MKKILQAFLMIFLLVMTTTSSLAEDYQAEDPKVEVTRSTTDGLTLSLNGVAEEICGEWDEDWCKTEAPDSETTGPFLFEWGDGSKTCSWFPGEYTYEEPGDYTIIVHGKNTCGKKEAPYVRVSVREKEEDKCSDQKIDITSVTKEDGYIKVHYTVEPYSGNTRITLQNPPEESIQLCPAKGGVVCDAIEGEDYHKCYQQTTCKFPEGTDEHILTIEEESCEIADSYTFEGSGSGEKEDYIWAYLNTKFKLSKDQTAKIKELGMELTHEGNYEQCYDCPPCDITNDDTSTCGSCPSCKKGMLLSVKMPTSCDNNLAGTNDMNCESPSRKLTLTEGETEIISGYDITLQEVYDSKAILMVSKHKYETPIKFVRLDEKFGLEKGQKAIITDYNRMEVKFTGFSNIQCVTAPCNQPATVTVTMLNYLEQEDRVGGMSFTMNEGQIKDVFGAKLRYMDTKDNGNPVFKVTASTDPVEGGVDISISPERQTIEYGEKATYKITIKDKHDKYNTDCWEVDSDEEIPVTTLLSGAPTAETTNAEGISYEEHIKNTCNNKYTYYINIQGLPFYKDYQTRVSLAPGEEETIRLVVKPYNVIEPQPMTEVGGGNTDYAESGVVESSIAKISKTTGYMAAADETATVTSTSAIYPDVTRTYTFKVKATLAGNSAIQDSVKAALTVTSHEKPKPPVTPPSFPGSEKVSMKLHKGWNLISLPGKLIKFDKESIAGHGKLVGYVWLKDKQEYVTLNEAERILGSELREYLAKNSFWVYTKSPMNLNIWIDKETSYNDLTLAEGWNLLPITQDMVGGYLEDITGDCSLSKLYLWQAEEQDWQQISLDYEFKEEQVAYGFLTKSEDDCTLEGPEIELLNGGDAQ